MKLSLVIPTFSRYEELNRCLKIIVSEIDKLSEEQRDRIEVIVGDNCSPVCTDEVIYRNKVNCNLIYIRRNKNIGLTNNVIELTKIANGDYVMWLTDDDFLIDGAIKFLLDLLDKVDDNIGYIWSNLPTFDTRSGKIITIAFESFFENTLLEKGRLNASKFAPVGWALSRQIYKKSTIDFEGVARINNAYFPIYLAANAMINHQSLYVNSPYVVHSYFNTEHWEEWGNDILDRKLRIFCDSCTILELSIKPKAHETEILSNLKDYRLIEMNNYKSSSHFNNLVERDGVAKISNSIKANLGDFTYLFDEIKNFLFQ